jgi:hypothetical protein
MANNVTLVVAIEHRIHMLATKTDFINVNRRVKSCTMAFRLRIRFSLTSPGGRSICLNLKNIFFNFVVGSWMLSMTGER